MAQIGTGHYSIRSQQLNLFIGAVGPVVNTLTPIETLSADREPSQWYIERKLNGKVQITYQGAYATSVNGHLWAVTANETAVPPEWFITAAPRYGSKAHIIAAPLEDGTTYAWSIPKNELSPNGTTGHIRFEPAYSLPVFPAIHPQTQIFDLDRLD